MDLSFGCSCSVHSYRYCNRSKVEDSDLSSFSIRPSVSWTLPASTNSCTNGGGCTRATNSLSSAPPAANPTTTSQPPAQPGVTTTKKVALGLGVPLGILIFAAIAYMLWRFFSRRKRQENTTASSRDQGNTISAPSKCAPTFRHLFDS